MQKNAKNANQIHTMNIVKRIASFCFGVAFLMALVIFTGYGSQWISVSIAKTLFLVLGGLALLLNLISFRFGKHDPSFSLFYWLGTVVLFIGLMHMMLHWPFAQYILIAGMLMVGISFFVPNGTIDPNKKDNELLDEDL
jgi:uncharacterized membrane protein YhaH (DUF805 family)